MFFRILGRDVHLAIGTGMRRSGSDYNATAEEPRGAVGQVGDRKEDEGERSELLGGVGIRLPLGTSGSASLCELLQPDAERGSKWSCGHGADTRDHQTNGGFPEIPGGWRGHLLCFTLAVLRMSADLSVRRSANTARTSACATKGQQPAAILAR